MAQAEQCYIESQGLGRVNGVLTPVTTVSSIEYKTFNNLFEAQAFAKVNHKEDNILFDSTTGHYRVFSYLPKYEFVCTNIAE